MYLYYHRNEYLECCFLEISSVVTWHHSTTELQIVLFYTSTFHY